VATTTKCQHGLDAGTCLICATLQPAVDARPKPGRSKVPAGDVEVVRAKQSHRPRVGLLGMAVVVVAALFAIWFIIGLVWSILRVLELAVVGVVCGALCYRIGVAVGRHQR
jgi:hypothetical protein